MVKKRGRVSKLIPIIQRLLSKLLSPRSYFNAVTTVARFLLNKFEGRPNQLSSSSHAVPGNFDVDHHRRGAGQSVANARGAGFIASRGLLRGRRGDGVAAVRQIQIRCGGCNRRLADFFNEVRVGQVIFELKCPRCGQPHLEVIRPEPQQNDKPSAKLG